MYKTNLFEGIYGIQRNKGLTSYDSGDEVQIQSSLDNIEYAYKPQTRGKGMYEHKKNVCMQLVKHK